MDGDPRCQKCGASLKGRAVGELCTNCLLKLALEPPREGSLGEEERAVDPDQPKTIRYFGDDELAAEIARGGMGVIGEAIFPGRGGLR